MPLGMLHGARRLYAPDGCTSNTSRPAGPRRYRSVPAETGRGMAQLYRGRRRSARRTDRARPRAARAVYGAHVSRNAAPSAASDARQSVADGEPSVAELLWLVRLRWWAIAGVTAAWPIALALGLVHQTWGAAAAVSVLAGVNVLLLARAREMRGAPPSARRRLAILQIVVDYGALIALLHLSGSVENPFGALLLVHASLSGILLPRPQAVGLTALAAGAYAAVVAGEAIGWIPHHALGRYHVSCAIDGGAYALTALAYATSMFAATLLASKVRSWQIAAEEARLARERVAEGRERLARLGEVFAGVAHSVRNPLHGALNCADLLEQDLGDRPDVRGHFDLLRESLERIEQVVQRVLGLGRARPLEPRAASLVDVARDAVELAGARARRKGVRVALASPADVRAVCDPDALVEVVVNLIDNAVDASPEGGDVVVEVGVAEEAGVRRATLDVVDAGPGVPSGLVDRVFDPFFTTKPPGEGTGIGLALAKRVVDEHRGTIAIANRAGGGCRVRISLAMADESSADQEVP
ncbi:MAG: sensor histidine kinase [Deltaproteobacteria bacterium]|nr:MAG: sensor histidine kinase [Deltaproteobacteria bacterium]